MKLIVGLGNPGREYEGSRHNVGFQVVERLARMWQIEPNRRRFQGLFGTGSCGPEPVLLLQPQTYMNRSGASVAEAAGFYKLEPADLLVVLDDLALPLGSLRLRPEGSAGGHNGLQDVVERLGNDKFARLRVGIGAARPQDMVGHVLGRFRPDERPVMDEAVEKAAAAVQCWVSQGIGMAMNRYNTKKKSNQEPGED